MDAYGKSRTRIIEISIRIRHYGSVETQEKQDCRAVAGTGGAA
jgi:hypothetical protein